MESKLSDLKSHDQNILDRGDRGVDGCSGGGLVAVVVNVDSIMPPYKVKILYQGYKLISKQILN